MSKTVQDPEEEKRRVTDERRAALKVCRNNAIASRGSKFIDPRRKSNGLAKAWVGVGKMQYRYVGGVESAHSLLP